MEVEVEFRQPSGIALPNILNVEKAHPFIPVYVNTVYIEWPPPGRHAIPPDVRLTHHPVRECHW